MAKPKSNTGKYDFTTRQYICDYPESEFVMKRVDENGDFTYHSDSKGNNKVHDINIYKFQKVPQRNPKTGKIDIESTYSTFVADKSEFIDKLGPVLGEIEFERVIEELETLKKNPKNKLYTPEEHLAKTNPQAAQFDSEKKKVIKELEAKYKKESEEKDNRIKELEAKLGFNKR